MATYFLCVIDMCT